MRKLLPLLSVSAVVVASSWMLALPASAASIDITGAEEVTTNGARTLTATAAGGVGEFSSLSLKAAGNDLGAASCSTLQSSCSHSATWKPPSSNGTYDVVAIATRRLGGGDVSKTIPVTVNIPPARPTGVKASIEASAPVVTWKANPEKDLKAYRVERSSGGSSKSFPLGKVTRFSDSDAPAGVELTYRVFALRNSPLTASGIESEASAAARVLTPAPPEPEQKPEPAQREEAAARAQPDAVAVPDTDAPDRAGDPSGDPGGSQPGPSNPVTLPPTDSGPVDAPNVVAPVTVGPRRDLGFAPILPYSAAQLPKVSTETEEQLAPEPVEAEGGQGDRGLMAPVTLPNGLQRPVVQKSLYVAGAALLVVVALHIARAARRLGDLAETD